MTVWRTLFFSREVQVWFLLSMLTVLSWALGNKYASVDASMAGLVTSAAFIIAFLKIRFVVLHFMEIREAVIPLRLLFEAWIVIVCGSLVLAFLI